MEDFYKLLIVDDEDDVRNGMFCGVDWETWGYHAISQAENGIRAIEEIEKECPDVILTDIRMSKMDGLQLIDYVSKYYTQIKVVIISGYSDIEYYRKALEFKVYDYILKPTCMKDFEKVFTQLKKTLDQKRKESLQVKELKEQLVESLSAVKQLFLTRLVQGVYSDVSLIEEKKKFYGIHIENKSLYVMSINFESGDVNGIFTEEQRLFHDIFVTVYIQEKLKKEFPCILFVGGQNEMIGLLNCNGREKLLQQRLKEALEEIDREKNIKLFIGISSKCDDILQISNYYDQAVLVMKQIVFLSDYNILWFDSMKPSDSRLFLYDFPYEQIVNDLFGGNETEWQRRIDIVFDKFRDLICLNCDYIDCICNELYFSAVKQAALMNIQLNLDSEEPNFYQKISELNTLDAKKEMMLQTLQGIKNSIDERKQDKKTRLILEIESFIQKNYQNPEMSLTMLADRMNKSITYISSVYKTETGKNFNDVIISLRIGKAKELLSRTHLKIYQISQQIGYADCSYFTKIFKKYSGFSPMEYRNQVSSTVENPTEGAAPNV